MKGVEVAQVRLDEFGRYDVSEQAFEGLDISGSRIPDFSVEESTFARCVFRDINVDHAFFGAGRRQSVFVDCDFRAAHFADGASGNVRFERCDFREARITGVRFHGAEFVRCVFSGTLHNSIFDGRFQPPNPTLTVDKRTRNEFIDNDLSNVHWRHTAFRGGIDIDRQKLPRQGCVVVRNLPTALSVTSDRILSAWRPSQSREEVVRYLNVLYFDAETGQEATIVGVHDLCRNADASAEAALILAQAGA